MKDPDSVVTRRAFIASASVTVSATVVGRQSAAGEQQSEIRAQLQLGEVMKIPVRVAAGQVFETRILGASDNSASLGWLWLQGKVGSARIEVTDGNKSPFGEQRVGMGVCVIELFANSKRPVVIRIVGESSGFSGELSIDLSRP